MNFFQWIFFCLTIIFVSLANAQNGQPIFYPGILTRRLGVLQPNGQVQEVRSITFATPVPLPLERQQQLRQQRQAAALAQLRQPAPQRQPLQQPQRLG